MHPRQTHPPSQQAGAEERRRVGAAPGSAGEVDVDAPAGRPDSAAGIASSRDAGGVPLHRGWAPVGSRHRWIEPFVMVQLAGGPTHGYAIIGELDRLGITSSSVDVGQVYRTLRDLEEAGQVSSSWATGGSGPARREYRLTEAGMAALDQWAAVMKERARLVAEFDARYLEWLGVQRR